MTGDLLSVPDANRRLARLGYHLGHLIRTEQIGVVRDGHRYKIPVAEVERIESGHRTLS